jgi:hypothetical protein
MQQAHTETGLPCHLSFDPLMRKGMAMEKAFDKAHVCVGALQNANASCKRYTNPALAAFAKKVGKSPLVLGLMEFINHHKSPFGVDHGKRKNVKA